MDKPFGLASGISCMQGKYFYLLQGELADFLRVGVPADWFADHSRTRLGRTRWTKHWFEDDGRQIKTHRAKDDYCRMWLWRSREEKRDGLPPQLTVLRRLITAHKGALAKIVADLPAIADSLRAEVVELYRPGPARPA